MRLRSLEVHRVDKKKFDFGAFMRQNAVTVMFIVLCAVCMFFSGQSISFVLLEMFGRLSRNAFIVLALIIPIVAGMGINFAITIGAMAAQIALLWVVEWNVMGIGGFLLAALITVPLAAVFGLLIGMLLNKMKGQEMIGGLILGYFANGLYQLLFLFIFGNLVPLKTPGLVIKGSTGVANTIALELPREISSKLAAGEPKTLKYALDNILNVDFGTALLIATGIFLLYCIYVVIFNRKKIVSSVITLAVMGAGCAVYYFVPAVKNAFVMVKVPVVTFGIVALLCVFNNALMKTRLGQQFRAVGQNRTVANASGINVNAVRLIAIMISTVLAGWGQLIFIQNMGTFQTYGAHEQVGLYAGAAILVGGASIKKATNKQAILGCILFHLLFLVAPPAAKTIFGDAAIGEYFRVFISYGVIAMALVMHAWSGVQKKKKNALSVQ